MGRAGCELDFRGGAFAASDAAGRASSAVLALGAFLSAAEAGRGEAVTRR